MTIKAFQFAVMSKGLPGKRVFAVEAATEPSAQLRLEKDKRVPAHSTLKFERILSSPDIARYGIEQGSIVQMR